MDRPAQDGQVVIADKNYYGAAFEAELAKGGITLIRPRRKGERPRSGQRFLRPLRQIIESVNESTTPSKDSSTSRATAPAPRRSLLTHHPTNPGPDSRYLAQQPHQRACPTNPDPYDHNPLGLTHLGEHSTTSR